MTDFFALNGGALNAVPEPGVLLVGETMSIVPDPVAIFPVAARGERICIPSEDVTAEVAAAPVPVTINGKRVC